MRNALVLRLSVQPLRQSRPRALSSLLHRFIRDELADRQWSYGELANRLNVPVGMVSRWLSCDPAKRVVPLPQYCVRIAHVLDADPIEVFRLAGYLPALEPEQLRPHQDDVRRQLRRFQRTLESIRDVPEPEWDLAMTIVTTQLESLQILLDRLANEHWDTG